MTREASAQQVVAAKERVLEAACRFAHAYASGDVVVAERLELLGSVIALESLKVPADD